MSNQEYKIAETKARYSRDEMIQMLLDYVRRSWEDAIHDDLVAEIVELHEYGCKPFNKYSNDELAEFLVDERKLWGDME